MMSMLMFQQLHFDRQIRIIEYALNANYYFLCGETEFGLTNLIDLDACNVYGHTHFTNVIHFPIPYGRTFFHLNRVANYLRLLQFLYGKSSNEI